VQIYVNKPTLDFTSADSEKPAQVRVVGSRVKG
jgi:hypothetical protein